MSDDLTPTQTLMLEVLIARHRLGEGWWTFDRNKGSVKAAKALVELGYVFMGSGKVERSFEAGLTEMGVREFMPKSYNPPILRRLHTMIDGTEWDVSTWRGNWVGLSEELARICTDAES